MEKIYDYFINKVFTIPYLDRIISGNSDIDTFRICINRHLKKDEDITYGDAISKIYHYMSSSYRNEYFYKNAILNQLLIEKHDLSDTTVLTELPVGDSKADIIMINGKGVVYEIKTDLDNFSRLKNQINDYYKAFKYVNVVVGYKQFDKAKEILGDSKVGIFVMCKNGKLRCKKVARSNDKDLSYETIFRILRKKEFESILLKHYGKLPEVNNFYYYRECLKWLSEINIKTLQKEMLSCLKMRMLPTVEEDFKKQVPYELRFYAYFTKKKSNQYQALNEFWHNKMEV